MLQKENLLCKYCGSYFDTDAHQPRKIPVCGHVICEYCLDKKYKSSRKLLMCKFDRQIVNLQKLDEDQFLLCEETYKEVLNNLDQQKTRAKNEQQFDKSNKVTRRQTEHTNQNKLYKQKISKTNTVEDNKEDSEESDYEAYQSDDSYEQEVVEKEGESKQNIEAKEDNNKELRNTVDETCYLLENLQFAFQQNMETKKDKDQIKIDPEKLRKFEETQRKEQEFLKKYEQDNINFEIQIDDKIPQDEEDYKSAEESSEEEYEPQQKLSTLQTYERAGVFKDSLVSTVSFADKNRFTNNNANLQANTNFNKKPTPPQSQNIQTNNNKKQYSNTISISVNGMCWIHKNIQQQIFCLQCQTKICYQCAFEQHKNHRSKQIQQIEGEVSQCQEDLEKIMNQIEEREREQQKDQYIQKIKELADNKKENFYNQIENFVQEQIRKIKDFGKNVKTEIEMVLEQKLKESEELIQKCDIESEQQLSQMKKSLKEIQNEIDSQNDDVEKYTVILNNIQQVMQFGQSRQRIDNVRKYVNKVEKMSKENLTSLQLELLLNGEHKYSIKIKKPEEIIQQQDDKNVDLLFKDQLSPIQNLDLIQPVQQNNMSGFNRQQSQPLISQFSQMQNQQNNLQVYNWKDRVQNNNVNKYQHSYQNNLYTMQQRNPNTDSFNLQKNNIQLQVPGRSQNPQNIRTPLNRSINEDSDMQSNVTEEDLIQKLSINEQEESKQRMNHIQQMQINQQQKRYEKSRGRRTQNFVSHNTSLNKQNDNKLNFQQQRYPPINRTDTGNKSSANLNTTGNSMRRPSKRQDSKNLNSNNISRISQHRENKGIYNRPFRKQQSEADLKFESLQKNKKQNDSINKSINRKLSETHLHQSIEFNKNNNKEILNLYSGNKKYMQLNQVDQKQINNVLDLEKKNINEIKKNLKDLMNQKNVYQINLSQISKLKRCESRTITNIIQIIERIQKFKKFDFKQKYVRYIICKKTMQ